MYADGLKHSLQLPYQVFEDQRSGETLGKLQKMRTDVERVISTGINFAFTTIVGVVFVTIYAITVHWLIAPVYFSTIPLLGGLERRPEPQDQEGAEGHRGRDHGARRLDDGVVAQHRAGQEPRTRPAGDRPPERDHAARSSSWS